MNSIVYSINEINEPCIEKIDTFIFALDEDQRSIEAFQNLIDKNIEIERIIVLRYNTSEKTNQFIKTLEREYEFSTIICNTNQHAFLLALKEKKDLINKNNIVIDITCIRIPELFLLMKYIKMSSDSILIKVLYSIPFDYDFPQQPFTSFKGFVGNLNTFELFGYSGISENKDDAILYIFLGFEGALSLKIVEETAYRELVLVNSLPSFYQKYKDISILSNYSLMQNNNYKILFTPAANPFSVYNMLNDNISNESNVCIAPLGTKPTALGICLFALGHDNVRIIYPIPESYKPITTHEVLKTLVYDIDLESII